MGWLGDPPPFFPTAEHTPAERDAVNAIIKGKLYLTNYKGAESAAELKKMKCTHIVAVGAEFMTNNDNQAATKRRCKFWNHDIYDDETAGASMAAQLRSAAAFIQEALQKKSNCVLVHCAAGVSRSATVVLGYLILHEKKTLREAFAHVLSCRPVIWPNDGFMRALTELEEAVRGSSSLSAEEYERWGDYDGPAEEDPFHEASTKSEASRKPHHEGCHGRGLSKEARRAAAARATEEAKHDRARVHAKWQALPRKSRIWRWRNRRPDLVLGRLFGQVGSFVTKEAGRVRRSIRGPPKELHGASKEQRAASLDPAVQPSYRASQVLPGTPGEAFEASSKGNATEGRAYSTS